MSKVAASPGRAPLVQVRGLGLKLGGKPVLQGVSATFAAGKVTAVLGPSGSGKSTLITCLVTARRPCSGSVLVDGGDPWKTREAFRRELGYVPQDDVVHRELRVEAELHFAARLRLGDQVDEAGRRERVNRVIARLGLREARRRRIRRLSGGQRKRVNIAVELLADPRLLVMDEPASGLDPATEGDLVALLGKLAAEGRTVVLTTHSMEYLHKMDALVVLMEGRLVYRGTLEGLLAHFGIPHVADMYRKLRTAPAARWAARVDG